ncbi:hypothetical protein HC766_02290 [Candidatus Gracilibacteria bacterium]|nr:hypothetical protein [Candidatus Gracilibacteria bacterium]
MTINFTIFGAATFVNITHGVGNAFVGGYAGTQGTSADKIISKVTESIQNISFVRCGNLPEVDSETLNKSKDANTGVSKFECDEPSGTLGDVGRVLSTFGEIGDKSGANVTRVMREVLYLTIIAFAILIFWKGIRLALIRVVGLWLLMIISPLALVGYFSPFDDLKKYGKQWLDYFWKLALFYPAFIFGWILVGEMSTQFVGAANANLANNPATVSNTGSVLAEAQVFSSGNINSLILLVLGGIVTIGMMNLLFEFFEKSFNEIAKAGLDALQSTVGKSIGFATSTAGGAIRAGGKGAGLAIGVASKLNDKNYQFQIGTLDKQIANTSDPAILQKLENQKINLENLRQKRLDQGNFLKENVKNGFQFAGDAVEYTPKLMSNIASIPGGFSKNRQKQKEARIAGMDTRLMARTEAAMRLNPVLAGALAGVGYNIDADENFQRFQGLDQKTLDQINKKNKEDGKGYDFLDSEINGMVNAAQKKSTRSSNRDG